MKTVPVARLSNEALIHELRASIAHDCTQTARQVALINEVERRRLYAPAGYPSMFAFCVGELHLSEDAAYKRIRVARTARSFPRVLVALAEGRVHLSGLTLLSHHMKPENVDHATVEALLTAATHKSKREIEQIIAERFPKPDMVAVVRPIPHAMPLGTGSTSATGAALEGSDEPQRVANTEGELAPGPVGGAVTLCQAPDILTSAPAEEHARVLPLAPQRYGVQFTMDQAGHDLLRHVQNLLGNQVSPGDLAEVVVRALKLLAAQLEKQKFAATERPLLRNRRLDPDSRHVPARVKRAVWKRDGGQCTFVSKGGRRCESRWDLELDHVHAYARGGEATLSGIRLRCRAHNQYEAEIIYGVEFMRQKRRESMDANTESSTPQAPPAPR